MSQVCINIDELVRGISKVGLDALMHAAEISPFVTERTIGPDLPEYSSKPKEDHNQDETECKAITTPSKNGSPQGAQGPELENKTPPKTSPKTPVNDDKELNSSDLILSPNGTSFQHLDYEAINNSVLLREAEQQRRRSIRQKVIEMQDKHEIVKRNSAEKKRHIKEQHDTWLAEKRLCDTRILAEAEKRAVLQQQENEQELTALRQQTHRHLQVISFQGITQYHNKFRGKYENVARLIASIEKQQLLACEEYNWRLKELIPQFEQLIGKIKSGECGPSELRDAENTCKSLDALEESIIKALENIVHQEEQRTIDAKNQEQQRKQEEELQQQQHQQQQQQQQNQQQQKQEDDAVAAAAAATAALPSVPVPEIGVIQTVENTSVVTDSPSATLNFQPSQPQPPQATEDAQIVVASSDAQIVVASSDTQTTAVAAEASEQYVSAERFQFYTQINTFYQEKVERVKPLQTDENMKKYRFACQKAINIPVNAISAVNPQHLKDKFEKLYNFISGQRFKAADGQMVSVNDHPLGRDYCILLMAKKFVSQGDQAVSSNPQAAFPVATVIVSLWKLVPDFGQIFLAYTFKESPFLVPYFIPQKRGQAIEDYYKVLGYRVTNGQLEQQDMYLKRQAGIARLYAAVMITNGRQADGPQHPYGIEQAWRWLCNFLSLAPLPDICATLIMEMLQTVGADMWSAYGKQFVKLLIYIQQHYFPKLSAVDEGGPKTRLQLLLGNFLRDGQIPRAQGVLPSGFW